MTSRWQLADPGDAAWPTLVETLWARLAPQGQPLPPAHFVTATFARMGGRLALSTEGALGLLFPRGVSGGQRHYTLRLHGQGDLSGLAAMLAPAQFVLHDPLRPEGHSYCASHAPAGGFDLGTPGRAELAAIGALHAAVWGGGDEARYPDDLYSAEFAPATALVARRDGQLAGFLLGFYRFELPALAGLGLPWRSELAVESQVMAVAPAARRTGLAATLKRAQARKALAEGLDLIHWTADPLQYANAALNFGRLRALAGEHYADYYPFRNELNRVAASRLGLVWLPRSARGRASLADEAGPAGARARFPGCVTLNEGTRALDAPTGVPWIAIEIPADWTMLQREDLVLAARWREVSDALLGHHLGFAPGRYLICDVAAEGVRRYLIARRFTPELIEA